MRTTLKIVSHGVSAVLCTVVTIVGIVSILTATNLTRVRNELSQSMYPKIRAGDLVVYRPSSASSLHTGEVISFMRPGDPVPITHRITSVVRKGDKIELRTKGDNNPTPDVAPTDFPAHQVVWHVETRIPGAGRFVAAVTGSHGVPFVLGLMPLYLSLPYIRRLLTGKKRGGAHRAPRIRPPEPVAAQLVSQS